MFVGFFNNSMYFCDKVDRIRSKLRGKKKKKIQELPEINDLKSSSNQEHLGSQELPGTKNLKSSPNQEKSGSQELSKCPIFAAEVVNRANKI